MPRSFLRVSGTVRIALSLFLAGCAAASPALSVPARGRVTTYWVTTQLVRPYRHHNPKREVLVYTPPGYDSAGSVGRRYPAMYLLHGSPGNPGNFLQFGGWTDLLDQQILSKRIAPVILVIPDGNYAGERHGDSEWANSADGQDRFEDFLIKEIIPWTDAHLRTVPEARGRLVGGVSQGAYAAVNLALRNPRVFGNVLALSGYYRVGSVGWEHTIFGDNEALWNVNSPLYYVDAEARSPRAAAWKSLHIYLGAGKDEHRYTDETRELAGKLNALGIRPTLRISAGKHGWGLWNALFLDGVSILLPESGRS